MARTVASLPAGSRMTHYISIGVVAGTLPLAAIQAVLAKTKKISIRQRESPAHVVVYHVIALALYMQSSYREVLGCLREGIRPARGWAGSLWRHCTINWPSPLRSGRRKARGSTSAPGQPGRQHTGCRRRRGQRKGLWPARGEPRQRLSADPLRFRGRERYSRAVWQQDGGLRNWGNDAGRSRAAAPR